MVEEFGGFEDLVGFDVFDGGVGPVDRAGAEDDAGDADAAEFAGVRAEWHADGGDGAAEVDQDALGGVDDVGGGGGFERAVGDEGGFDFGAELGGEVGVAVPDLQGIFAGDQAAIERNFAEIGDEVDLFPAADEADVEGGGAEERVGRAGEGFGLLIEGLDDGGHVADGVDAQVRFGAVGGFATGAHAPAEDAFGGRNQAHFGGFGDDGGGGFETFAQAEDAGEGVLFIDDGGEPYFAGGRLPGGLDGGHGVHHGGEAGLGIARPAAVEAAVLDFGFEGRDVHAAHRDRVHVGFEDDAAVGVMAREAGDDVIAAGLDFLAEGFDVVVGEELLHVVSHGGFRDAAIVGEVDAGDGDEVGENGEDV